jgi:hypothetical protein
MRRLKHLAIGAAMIVLAADSCEAQTHIWNNANGGLYATPSNWIPNGVPDAANENAQFGLNATYDVLLNTDTTVGSLIVRRGDVTLTLGTTGLFGQEFLYSSTNLNLSSNLLATGATLRLANGNLEATASTIVSAEFAVGLSTLQLSNAQMTTGAATIGGGADATGRLVVNELSSWSVVNSTVLGGSGDATFEIQSGFRSSGIGSATLYFPAQGVATQAGVVMAQSFASDATATIDGIWNTGDLVVGDAGRASVSVRANFRTSPNGINVSSAGRITSGTVSIAAQPGSAGFVTVAGTALGLFSEWTTAGNLNIGGTAAAAGGTGELAIGFENKVSVGGGLKMWPGATLTRTDSSQLAVSGTANLAGALEYSLGQFTTAQLGSTYPVLTAPGGVTGAFASSVLPALPAGLRWVIHYQPTSVSLMVATALSADFNEDGSVDGADLARWRSGFEVGTSHTQGDADGDLDVDGTDLLSWQRELGTNNGGSAAFGVPEPATGLMFASCILATVRCRRLRTRRNVALSSPPHATRLSSLALVL